MASYYSNAASPGQAVSAVLTYGGQSVHLPWVAVPYYPGHMASRLSRPATKSRFMASKIDCTGRLQRPAQERLAKLPTTIPDTAAAVKGADERVNYVKEGGTEGNNSWQRFLQVSFDGVINIPSHCWQAAEELGSNSRRSGPNTIPAIRLRAIVDLPVPTFTGIPYICLLELATIDGLSRGAYDAYL
ncbi:hypothetical protein M747DRAFT_270855 [Aspergillus niger ATCC 13496]|uniref:Uncharacterized protein n=1 Tax=Aspergillus niger ATCC 13496 TaxID=1353008 RepID=A0A370BER2_ASPNG|nr:hypothetical protein M747DRAFT_270855 [Aspergillus niger ATCC 13496]